MCRAIFCVVFAILDDRITGISLILGDIFQELGSPTLLCIFGSHMFFNLKEAAEYGVNVGTNWSSYSHSNIQFGDGKSRFVKVLHTLRTHPLMKQIPSTDTISELISLANPTQQM